VFSHLKPKNQPIAQIIEGIVLSKALRYDQNNFLLDVVEV